MSWFPVANLLNRFFLSKTAGQLEKVAKDHETNMNNLSAIHELYNLAKTLYEIPINTRLIYEELFELNTLNAEEFLNMMDDLSEFLNTGKMPLNQYPVRNKRETTIYDWCVTSDGFLISYNHLTEKVKGFISFLEQVTEKTDEHEKQIKHRMMQPFVAYSIGELINILRLYISLQRKSL